jgi:hypothetical protein
MRCIITHVNLICVLLAFSAVRASAGPVAHNSIPKLCAQADAIIAGPIKYSTVDGTTFSATIVAERVLKGAVTEGTSIPVIWTSPSVGMGVAPGRAGQPLTAYGISFLQRNAGGSWSLLPIMNGNIIWDDAYLHIPLSLPQSARNVVAATLPPNASPLDKVLVEMLVPIEAGVYGPYNRLIDIFRESRSPVLAAAFTRFLSRSDADSVCVGLRGSLLGGDPSVISTIQRRYAALSSARALPALLDEIKHYYVDTAPQTIQTLGQIATDMSAGADLRAAAVGALARMHTKQSLPYLARLLGDQDGALRSMAAGGFAMFANNVPIGSHAPAPGAWPYRTDDTIAHSGFAEANVSFWQQWWLQNQAALTQ